MENKVNLDKYRGYESCHNKNVKHFYYGINTLIKKSKDFFINESIYFFAVDERNPELIKVGKTKDIVLRLRNYNVGRIKEVELKYFALVKNSLLIENCIKLKLKANQVFENKEIFRVDPKILKKVIDNCYCKYVSSKKNEEMYEDISYLLGLYSYTKDKVHIKPYVIIGKNI